MKRKTNIVNTVDWFTIGIFMLMVTLGWLNIYAAVYNDEFTSIFSISQQYGKQIIWIGGAFILAFMIIITESKFFSFFAYIIYAILILLLLLVPFIGKEVHGASSWFDLGGFHLQPSEFAKTATALALARYMSSFNVKLKQFKTVFYGFAIIILPSLLILLQPDWGSALVFSSFIFVLYREGLPKYLTLLIFLIPTLFILSLVLTKLQMVLVLFGISIVFFGLLRQKGREIINIILIVAPFISIVFIIARFNWIDVPVYFLMLISLGVAIVIFTIIALAKKIRQYLVVFLFFIVSLAFTYSVDYFFNNVLKEHQQHRINIVLGVESDPLGTGYNLNQSKIAIGSGGFIGKGFLQGTQTKFNFVPQQSTDFIFCTIGEEWGFLGTSFVVLLFMIFLLRLVKIAERQRSDFSRIYGYGVFAVFLFHFTVNIGMTIGLFPVIGIPLPFFSYGGSSLWSFTIMLFILINLDSRRLDLLR